MRAVLQLVALFLTSPWELVHTTVHDAFEGTLRHLESREPNIKFVTVIV